VSGAGKHLVGFQEELEKPRKSLETVGYLKRTGMLLSDVAYQRLSNTNNIRIPFVILPNSNLDFDFNDMRDWFVTPSKFPSRYQ